MDSITREFGPLARAAERLNAAGSPLGSHNTIISGVGSRYYAPDCEGWLSVKTVLSGSATWDAAGRRFVLHENSYLILNDRQPYTMTIDSHQRVATFCVFFERGFAEDVCRGVMRPDAELLEAPQPRSASPLGFHEKIEGGANRVQKQLRRLRKEILAGATPQESLEDRYCNLAEALAREHQQAKAVMAKLPAVRASTREELYRRLLRGRDFLLSSLDSDAGLKDAAREACLSRFHFHRTFTRVFGETPHAYLTRHRLERAAHLLEHTARSITEICLDSGFQSHGSFSTLFRRHFGVSPREFRLHPTKIRNIR